MSKKSEFLTNGVTKLAFSFDALEPIRKLYLDIMRDSLEAKVDIGIKAHEDYSEEFNSVSMRWFSLSRQRLLKFSVMSLIAVN